MPQSQQPASEQNTLISIDRLIDLTFCSHFRSLHNVDIHTFVKVFSSPRLLLNSHLIR